MLYNYVFWNQGLPVSNRETKCNLNYQTEFSKFGLIPSVFENKNVQINQVWFTNPLYFYTSAKSYDYTI